MAQDIQFQGGFTPESWEFARAFAGSLGTLPSSFTSVIRLLMADFDKAPKEISHYGRFFAGRLLKSPSLQAPYFYAIRFIKPEVLPDAGTSFGVSNFLASFSGYEHAALLAIIFVHRHCSPLCQPELFDAVTERLERDTTISWLIGNAIPSIGGGAGALLGSFRVLGFLPFLKHDPEGFAVYWKHLSDNGRAIDTEFEFDKWQCNSLQIAVMLGQQIGFGIRHVIPLMKAITTTSPLLAAEDKEREFRVIDVWMESLMKWGTAPAIPLPPKYYPNKLALDQLTTKSANVIRRIDCAWLTKGKKDLSRTLTPQLFVGEPESLSPQDEGFPAEVVEEVGDQAINELSHKLLKDFLTEDDNS
jgi:hypothetical protein